MRHDNTDMSLADVLRLAGQEPCDPERLWIVYGPCGQHEVYLTDNPEEPDSFGVPRGQDEHSFPRLDEADA